MFIIGREDWDLLQAVKDLGLTAEKVKEMDDPAPLPFKQDECPVNNEDWEGGL